MARGLPEGDPRTVLAVGGQPRRIVELSTSCEKYIGTSDFTEYSSTNCRSHRYLYLGTLTMKNNEWKHQSTSISD